MSAQEKTEDITVLIDIQNGFASHSLTEEQGGCLYVPGGEYSGAAASALIAPARNQTFVLSQDFHPDNHISFMTNHPGVMEYRTEKFTQFLQNYHQPLLEGEELALKAQQPVHFIDGKPVSFPFDEIVLDGAGDIIGLKEGDRIRQVKLDTSMPSPNARGRVERVLDSYEEKNFSEIPGARTQVLWTRHCQQGTQSSMFDPAMNLPKELLYHAQNDRLSKDITYHDDATGNTYYIIRKGYNSEVDSYGIALENDKRTLTTATDVFGRIADQMATSGVNEVNLNIGGLATNFCVEFSVNNIHDLITGLFRVRGIKANVNFIKDVSYGIPIPGGKEDAFSLEGAPERMAEVREGTNIVTIKEVLGRCKPSPEISGSLKVSGKAQDVGRVA